MNTRSITEFIRSMNTAFGHVLWGIAVSLLASPIFVAIGGYWILLTASPGIVLGVLHELAQQRGWVVHVKQKTDTAVLDALEFALGGIIATAIIWTNTVILPQCQRFIEKGTCP